MRIYHPPFQIKDQDPVKTGLNTNQLMNKCQLFMIQVGKNYHLSATGRAGDFFWILDIVHEELGKNKLLIKKILIFLM